MGYMKVIDLSSELGQERPYIVALQSELPGGKNDLSKLTKNLEQLESKMAKVKRELACLFYMQCSFSRQFHSEATSPAVTPVSSRQSTKLDVPIIQAPANLHSAFDSSE